MKVLHPLIVLTSALALLCGPAVAFQAMAPAARAQEADPPQEELIADFRAERRSGDEPLTVDFLDISTPYANITSWWWDFGDGGSSTERNPTHVYVQDGEYTVSLTVTAADGEIRTATEPDYITVWDKAPGADFSATPTSGPEPLTVEFTDLSTSHDGIISRLWDFGDGQTSAEQDPTYQYVQDGVYTVSLAVTDADGDGDTETRTDLIAVYAPSQADFSASATTVAVGDTVTFTDLSTGDITTWHWNFDNDDKVDSTASNPTHCYDTAGVYDVSLTIICGGSSTDVETKTGYITVIEAEPDGGGASSSNLPLIGGAAGGAVVAVGAVISLLARRRRRATDAQKN
jgi:PKD repeat protein